MDIELPPDFKEFLRLLHAHGVKHLLTGVGFDECYAERVIDSIGGIEVSLISLRHLKINKRSSGRHKDLDDLEHLP